MERILICSDAILQAYREVNRPVPLLDNDRTVCIEFNSLIYLVQKIQVKVQAMQNFVVVDVYLLLFTLSTTTLDLSKPLALLEPSRRQLGSAATNNVTYRPCEQLQECTREARSLLLEALSTSFYHRYNPIYALQKTRQGPWHGSRSPGCSQASHRRIRLQVHLPV